MLRLRNPFGILLFLLLFSLTVFAAQTEHRANESKPPKNSAASQEAQSEAALQKAVTDSSNDRAALVRNLEAYLQRFPDSKETASVYRALVESCQQLQDSACALEYAEKLIAVQPDNSEMMMLAVGLLDKQGDDASLVRAKDYLNRVLDQTEKLIPEDRPERESLANWRSQQTHLLVALYLIRGRIETEQKDLGAAVPDLQKSFSLKANAPAAEKLGEIAEQQHHLNDAIQQYSFAFVLPEEGAAGAADRRTIRQKLGNVWKQAHGSEAGLGDEILAAYDKLTAPAEAATAAPNNSKAKDLFDYVLQKPDGSPFPLAPLRGRVVVLNFWATWCEPCRDLEPVFARVAQSYSSTPGIYFAAVNVDEDQSRVPDFIQREKMTVPVLYSDGLDSYLNVNTVPMVFVLDRSGRIVYSGVGFDGRTFVDSVSKAIELALKQPNK